MMHEKVIALFARVAAGLAKRAPAAAAEALAELADGFTEQAEFDSRASYTVTEQLRADDRRREEEQARGIAHKRELEVMGALVKLTEAEYEGQAELERAKRGTPPAPQVTQWWTYPGFGVNR